MSRKIITIAEHLEAEFEDIIWTSGSRCSIHNASPQVRGAKTSGHLAIWGDNEIESVALDWTLKPWNPFRARKVCQRAVQHGARGIGYMPEDEAGHIDLKPRIAWWVIKNGKIYYFF